jgi:glycogen synthase
MHVLLLGPYPPPHGGVQSNLVAIREYLTGRGVRCSVINLTRHRQPEHDGIWFPNSGAEVLRLMFRLRPSIAHLHIGGDITPRLLALGFACTQLAGAGSVMTLHSGGYPSSPEGRSAARGTLRGFVFRRFSRMIAVNAELAKLYLRFGVREERIRTIAPHALVAAAPRLELPENLESFLLAHDPVLISMGWLEPEYGYPLQIRTLGGIRKRRAGAGLLILGAGRGEAELRRQIQATDYAADVLLAGDVPHGAALAALARSQVFLRTTAYDGDSVSVREALHLGIPVAATDNGMRPEGVILMRNAEPEALEEAVEEALRRGRQAGSAKADWSNVEAVFELYRELDSSTPA